MQRQKVIAKWLAIILLLTVATACYLVLSAVLKKSPDDPASESGGLSGTISDSSTDSEEEPPAPPVYSQLPRACVAADGIEISHVGGESDETMLDAFVLDGKQIVLFSTQSQMYDVREKGLHAAIFDGGELIGTKPLRLDGTRYIASKLMGSGILVMTGDENVIYLTLLDDALNATAIKKLDDVAGCYPHYEGSKLRLFLYDGRYLGCASLSQTLDVSLDRSVLALDGCDIRAAYFDGESDALVIQSGDDLLTATYSQNSGFKLTNTLAKRRFVQSVPHMSDGKPIYLTLSEGGGKAYLNCFDRALDALSEICFDESSAVLTLAGDNIRVTTDKFLYTYCSHLQLESKAPVVCDEDMTRLIHIEGEDEYMLCRYDGGISVLAACDGELRRVLDLGGVNAAQVFRRGSSLCIFFEGDYKNLAFGENDIFFITVLT